MQFTNEILALLIGFTLDAIFGDPRWIPHPVIAFGHSISYFEKRFNHGFNRKLKGAIVSIFLILITFSFFTILKIAAQVNDHLLLIFNALFLYLGLANHGLIKEVWKVNRVLSTKGLEAGRNQLTYIVGRDTSKLSEKQIRIASLETLSENLSDGTIAPLLFYAIGGIPLLFAYKMINTLDSMIGYKNEKYKDFGWFAAKTDDIFNLVPARLTALLMAITGFNFRAFKFIIKYGNKHSSPNAGYPEAALAGILNCQFGGPNYYFGKYVDKPFIGEKDREIHQKDVVKACFINVAVSLLLLISIIFLKTMY